MTFKRWFFLLTSIVCYWMIVHDGIWALLILSILIVVADRTKSSMLAIASIALLVLGFVYFKVISSNTTLYGYSVFAFTGISFLVDQYKKRESYSILDTFVFLFFFPKMLAGPIVRVIDFIPQLSKSRCSSTLLYRGFKLVIYALFVKFIIADVLLSVETEHRGINLLLQSFIWGIRFYFDFYAYSLLAVGVALVFGIVLPYNFDNPYSAQSFKDFWQRWNITLSTWLRTYIYIPLGGNRCSKNRAILNILVTFVVSALWHGLTIPFVFWGLAHAGLICLERYVFIPFKGRWMYRVFVLLSCIFLWQFFRFNNMTDIDIYFYNLTTEERLKSSLLLSVICALVSLYVIESQWLKHMVFKMRSSHRAIICEVTFFALLITMLVFFPISYSFNFFYLNF